MSDTTIMEGRLDIWWYGSEQCFVIAPVGWSREDAEFGSNVNDVLEHLDGKLLRITIEELTEET